MADRLTKMSETLNKGPNLERQSSESLTIPERRVIVKDANDLPSTYSQTPGGTIFSTTPGGMYCQGQGSSNTSVIKGKAWSPDN